MSITETVGRRSTSVAAQHLRSLQTALDELEEDLATLDRWGRTLAEVLTRGGRLLVAGNGGSAAQAQHLSAELVGRYHSERPPFSAIALHADTSALTAITNDYGADQCFARQVSAHGRPGDILMLLSTSGRSENVLAAIAPAEQLDMSVLALTGSGPNPLAELAHDTVSVTAETPIVQEVHQVAIHLICEAFDERVMKWST